MHMARSFRSASKSRKRTRILLVDDHPLVRERLAEIINREPDLSVCAEADDRHQAIELIKLCEPHLLIVDLILKNSDGVELIKDVHSRWPKLLVLVVSMHDETLYAERVLRAGARGYITKQEATRSILVAIRQVLQGQIFLNGGIGSQILGRLMKPGSATSGDPVESLADRELQVYELIGHGLDTREIATLLYIGAKTVETYRHRIREKLQLNNPNELLRSAIAWVHHNQTSLRFGQLGPRATPP
jgi:DNA-binding NarL/FixJ family response regulator